ncbi:hypothetical protein MNV49_004385 [Pseudohyphozyma bogoriensis]|nr:hypothetical protein MNV49_004385 [Pseudohyphozyma bogoriensis]
MSKTPTPKLPLQLDHLPPLLPLTPGAPNTLAAITHRSYHARQASRFQCPEGHEDGDFERLEHVGDAVLELALTFQIHRLYPRLTPEARTLIRSSLVSNAALSVLSGAYNLPNQLRGAPLSLQQNEKTRADMFEAYVGAVSSDSEAGLNNTIAWIETVFAPLIKVEYERRLAEEEDRSTRNGSSGAAEMNGGVKRNAISVLQEAKTKKRIVDVNFAVKQNGEGIDITYTTVCTFKQGEGDPESTAEGTGRSKQESKNRAAEAAVDILGI